MRVGDFWSTYVGVGSNPTSDRNFFFFFFFSSLAFSLSLTLLVVLLYYIKCLNIEVAVSRCSTYALHARFLAFASKLAIVQYPLHCIFWSNDLYLFW